MTHETNSFPEMVAALHGCDRGRNCFYETVAAWPDRVQLPVDAPEGVGVWTFERVPGGRSLNCQVCIAAAGGECVVPCLRGADWTVTDPDGRSRAYCTRDLYDMVPWPTIAPGGDDGRFWRAARG